jgi:pilus assembly protein CpaF
VSTRIVDKLASGGPQVPEETPYQRAKRELHAQLVGSLELSALPNLPREKVQLELRGILTRMVHDRQLALTRAEQDNLIEEILDEVLGFGPLERLLRMPDVTDILVNGPDTVYIERKGVLEQVPVRFRDVDHLLHVINRIVSAVGRRVDEATPLVDARLPDGSRFNAVIAPIALEGPLVSIRRFGAQPIRAEDLIQLGSVPEPIMRLLQGCVRAKMNVLVSGGTGSGKTTLLNVLSSFIPDTERIVTIEDAAELMLQQRHVVRMETRPPNLEGEGQVTPRALVRNALRMRPDRIIVGEIRGDEAIDMLQAMNTGHEGSLCTIHANSPRHALGRLQTMVGLGLGNISGSAIREMVSDAIHLIVQVARHVDGRRRLVSIIELTGMEGEVISTQEVFRFRQRTVDPTGHVRGVFEATGIRPMFAKRLAAHGVEVAEDAFRYQLEV